MKLNNKFYITNKMFYRFAWSALLLILIGLIYIGFYWIDGKYIRPITTFTQGVNPLEFKLEKEVYKKGEMVKAYTSFCKNRNAEGYVLWTLVNERIFFYAPEIPDKALPIGCYPENQKTLILFNVQTIPEDAKEGEHYFVGIRRITLPSGRVITETLKTEVFLVQ